MMRGRIAFVTLAALGIAVSGTFASGPEAEPERTFVVLVEDGGDVETVARAVADVGGAVTRTSPQIGMIVATSGETDFVTRARGIEGVTSAALSLPVKAAIHAGTADSLSGIGPTVSAADEASLNAANPPNSGDDDVLFDAQWGLDAIDAPEAWDGGERGAKARVFVLDTGLDPTHPDIAPNVNTALCTSFVPNETYDSPFLYPFHHGTHVAGIIAAADNGVGTIGVAPEAELVSVKVLSSVLGYGYTDWIAAGIVYAADNGADVINMSLGGRTPRRGYWWDENNTPDDTTDDVWVSPKEISADLNAWGRALDYAHKKGVTIVVSAGNARSDANADKDIVIVPAQLRHVISVSATSPVGWGLDQTTDLDQPAPYSNNGQSLVDLSAPGGAFYQSVGFAPVTIAGLTRPAIAFDGVLAPSQGNRWFWAAGTSMAAPHVSGVAALIISKNGGSMKPAEVYAALKRSSDDIGSKGRDAFYGHGRVNAHNAVK
jgi:subtilisin family serine protease